MESSQAELFRENSSATLEPVDSHPETEVAPKSSICNILSSSESTVNVVLFGNSSAVCFGDENILLGKEHVHPEQDKFPRRREISGRDVSVINILDFYEGEMYLDPVEYITGQLLNENNIHSFIFVLQQRRFTDADKRGIEWLQKTFGESVLPFVMILFTYEREEDSDTIIDDLKKNPVLEQLLQKCGDRYHTCSKSMNNQSEMKTLLEKIDHMVSENNQRCYTAEIYNTTSTQKEQLQDSKTQQTEDEAPGANLTVDNSSDAKTEEQTKIIEGDKEENPEHGTAEDRSQQFEEKQKTELFIKLNLTGKLEQKMKIADVLQITKPSSENDLVHTFLQRLLLMNYTARCGEGSKINQTHSDGKIKQTHPAAENADENDVYNDLFTRENEEAVQISLVHPMDVQMAVFHCSDHFLRELIVTKLSQCQYAVPLLVPNPFTREIEFPLWTFRQIKKSWKTTDKISNVISKEKTTVTTDDDGLTKITCNEKAIATADTPMVAFFRLGDVSSSKSQLIDSVINKKHSTFFHRHCPGSNTNRLLMDGVVEIAWYLPSGKSTDHFTDCVAFCNLHGDAGTHEKQLEILSEMSSVNVVFLPNLNKNDKRMAKLQKLYKLSKPMICLLSEESSHVTQTKAGKYKIGLKDRNQSDISEELTTTIRDLISKPSVTFKLENVAKHSGIQMDEELEDCKRGREAAKDLTNLLEGKDLSRNKEIHLPCQGRLWKNWCQMNKELHKPQGYNIELKKSKKQMEMKNLREQQKACGLREFMKMFIEKLNSQTTDEMVFVLKWITIFLDNYTANISSFRNEYYEKWSKILNLKKSHDKSGQLETEQAELEKISEKINAAAFGLEHILREIGQIYESNTCVQKNKKEIGKFNVSSLPRLVADLMISGFPLELMDGDTAHVPQIWVSAVLDEVRNKLGDQRVFVLSVLGIQSSGKSTMLNAMFGLQFSVSAGKCTRGAFMQLVKVSEEMKVELKFDYILVIDTEGLRAPVLAGMSTRHHDNELATFVIGLGNMTLINIFGENPTEMQDILQIVVQAFLRMKKVRLNPSCMFVHQNVGDITAGEKNMEGRRCLQEKLDEMTKLAAKEEACDAECFSDIITFDVQCDVSKLEQPILQAVCKQTAIDVAADMKDSSRAFSSNKSNLEKHILKSLAEEEDFEKVDSDESVPFKQYRSAGGVYAKWNITPDCSELPYWKWFVCKFQKDLENFYGKKFQGLGEIPGEWKMYTKEDAIESLNSYI
ncbi:hypothetical protein SRHO_G00009750 [Serrasalmus rhombeus]